MLLIVRSGAKVGILADIRNIYAHFNNILTLYRTLQ